MAMNQYCHVSRDCAISEVINNDVSRKLLIFKTDRIKVVRQLLNYLSCLQFLVENMEGLMSYVTRNILAYIAQLLLLIFFQKKEYWTLRRCNYSDYTTQNGIRGRRKDSLRLYSEALRGSCRLRSPPYFAKNYTLLIYEHLTSCSEHYTWNVHDMDDKITEVAERRLLRIPRSNVMSALYIEP